MYISLSISFDFFDIIFKYFKILKQLSFDFKKKKKKFEIERKMLLSGRDTSLCK